MTSTLYTPNNLIYLVTQPIKVSFGTIKGMIIRANALKKTKYFQLIFFLIYSNLKRLIFCASLHFFIYFFNNTFSNKNM